MHLIKKIKRQIINVKDFNAVNINTLLRNGILLPYYYYFSDGLAPSPMNITLDLTYRCNLKCKFCSTNTKNRVAGKNNVKELSFGQIKSVVEQAIPFKPSFLLTGGEIGLRKDLYGVVYLIKSNGLKCGIFTNGTCFNSKKTSEILSTRLDYIMVSLDGDREVHDNIRGVKGSFDKTYSFLKFVSQHRHNNTRLIVNMVINKENKDLMIKVLNICNELRIDSLTYHFLNFLNSTDYKNHKHQGETIFQGKNFKTDIYVTKFKPFDISKEIKEVKLKSKYSQTKIFFKPDPNNDQIKKWFLNKHIDLGRCYYPWGSMRISPSGDIYPCPTFFLPMGNIKNDLGILKIWNNKNFRDFRNTLRREGTFLGCNRCVKL